MIRYLCWILGWSSEVWTHRREMECPLCGEMATVFEISDHEVSYTHLGVEDGRHREHAHWRSRWSGKLDRAVKGSFTFDIEDKKP